MKITFNPTIKNYQTCFKTQKHSNAFNRVANYNLNFGKRAIYVIDYEGNYEKFESAQQAKEKYNMSNISHILTGKISTSKNKTLIYADEMELKNGEINLKAINKALLAFRDASKQPVYVIDFYGNIQKFENIASASKLLNIEQGAISSVLTQNIGVVRGCIFAKAFDIEKRDKNGKLLKNEDGSPVVDFKKINKLREDFLYVGKYFPIVSIDKDGNIEQFKDTIQASLKTNNNATNIRKSLQYGIITQEKYTYARLADVVQVDEFGDVVFDENNDFAIDYDKVEQLRQMAFERK